MSTQMYKQKTHSPTLATVQMVEDILKGSETGTLKVSEIKRLLPKQVNHNTLKVILDYLDKSNRIYIGMDGITWIHNDNPVFRKLVREGIDVTRKFPHSK